MLGYPLMPLYGMLFIAVAIYVYYWILRVLSRPMDRRWMQSNRSVFYLALLGVMFVVVVIFILGISVVYAPLTRLVFINNCPSNALHSSIGQNIKSLACPLSDLRCPARV